MDYRTALFGIIWYYFAIIAEFFIVLAQNQNITI